MKKVMMCVVLVVLSAAVLSATASGAARELGIGSGCDIHAWNAQGTVNGYEAAGAEGAVTCNTNQNIWVAPCLQQLVTGGWQTVVYAGKTECGRKPSSGSSSSTDVDTTVGYVPMTCNRYYRASVQGDANGTTDTYNIPGFNTQSLCIS